MSEPNGQGTESGSALGQLADNAEPDPGPATSDDPWFAAPPKPLGYQPLDAEAMDSAGWPKPAGQGQDGGAAEHPAAGEGEGRPGPADAREPEEWFLRAGRAALLPESITENWDDEDTHVFQRPDIASVPPWSQDEPDQDVAEPPPWESGPWPGPGEARPVRPPQSSEPRIRRRPGEDTDNW
jgi:hypothetical protein